MKRSVYSLVLMDDIIKAVDAEAYRRGTSRSNLINQILAENLSCITPEMRMHDIFESLSELISSSFQIQQQRSASLLTLKTALEYKYRPTINYKVELERVPDQFIGTLKVQIRTQSDALIQLFNSFFAYRIKFEATQLASIGYNNYTCELGNGSFTRKLLNTGLSEDHSGEAISCYLSDLNTAIQAYFSAPQLFYENAPELEKKYIALLSDAII
ncbi:MAG: hypothetical protein IJM38_08550 [Ruminococcus sp.]|nr:hypothetical protein [Ruminococcus sp.]